MENNKTTGLGQTALITGATSGIGKEIARLFAKDGYNLILVARTESDLNMAAKELGIEGAGAVTTIAKDLFGETSARELYDEVQAKGLQVDVLVNDAGQGVYGMFVDTPLEDELAIIHLNVVSLVVLTKLFLKDMVKRGSGKILQLASVVSKAPAPLQAVYGGTKGFVYNFTQALINELKDTPGVTMTALLPGATDTDFFHKEGADNMRDVVEGKLADPADVAKEGYDALMSGGAKVIAGMKNKLNAAMGNLMPDQAIAAQMRHHSEPVDKEDAD
jgi:short-subunit dehydrogenase